VNYDVIWSVLFCRVKASTDVVNVVVQKRNGASHWLCVGLALNRRVRWSVAVRQGH
jgi:hypothetical protein